MADIMDLPGRLELLESGPPPAFRVVGDLISENAATIGEELGNALAANPEVPLILDMSWCGRMDVIGMTVLVRTARSAPGRVIVAAPTEFVRSMLEVGRLDRLVRVADTVEQARWMA
jgi:anti-anti-sigma factor